MPVFSTLRNILLIAAVLISAIGLPAQEEKTKGPEASGKDTQAKGMPPRAAPSEYQAQAQAGKVTIGAEFLGHALPTPEQTVESEDYIVVEAGLFGPPGSKITLARGDFSLRINGKKAANPSEPYELVFHSLKDPQWQPPETPEKAKGSTSLTTGGGGGGGDGQPPPYLPRCRSNCGARWNSTFKGPPCKKATAPAASRTAFLPVPRQGREHSSLELIYNGAAGTATLTLQP